MIVRKYKFEALKLRQKSCVPVHEILVLTTYTQKSLLNTNSEVSSQVIGLNFGRSLQHPYCKQVRRVGSGPA